MPSLTGFLTLLMFISIVIMLLTGTEAKGRHHDDRDRGEHVRVLTRDAVQAASLFGSERGLELVDIDFGSPGEIAGKLRGSDRVFIGLGTTPTQVGNEMALIDAAAAGIQHTVIRPTTFIDAIAAIAAGLIPKDAWGGHTAGGKGAFVDGENAPSLLAASWS
jgi:uncharacterized protein YbjT (DUF2867 family)